MGALRQHYLRGALLTNVLLCPLLRREAIVLDALARVACNIGVIDAANVPPPRGQWARVCVCVEVCGQGPFGLQGLWTPASGERNVSDAIKHLSPGGIEALVCL